VLVALVGCDGVIINGVACAMGFSYSDESEQRFHQLAKNVEFRCPVMNLLNAAGVDMTVTWVQKLTSAYQGSVD